MVKNNGSYVPFPLKRYFLIYGGSGAVVFYILLFLLLIRSERQVLYKEYVQNLSLNAHRMFSDIRHDFLDPNNIRIETLNALDTNIKNEFRSRIKENIESDYQISNVKIFKTDAITLYNHTEPKKIIYLQRSIVEIPMYPIPI